jgi:hypothetical protein
MSLTNWKPASKRTYEDNLLLKYWQKVGGIIFTEVVMALAGPPRSHENKPLEG